HRQECLCYLGLAAEEADGVGEGGVACGPVAVGAGWGLGAVGFSGVAFAGREEEIGLDGVLLGVEIEVASAHGVERFVGAALDDAAGLDHKDLFGAADGGKTVGNDKCGASAHEIAKAFLD